jgi:GNAT superfamily N-acetyltransferase
LASAFPNADASWRRRTVIELTPSKVNRVMLARAFRRCKRVDLSIDCVIEGQMGKALADHPENPKAFKIAVGPFCYFAGDAENSQAREMMKDLSSCPLLMPSTAGWVDLAKEVHGEKLTSFARYSFSSENLAVEHLDRLLDDSPFRDRMQRIDTIVAGEALAVQDGVLDLSDFDSAEDFVERGIGFRLMSNESVMGVAFSSLVCSKGIEVSIFVFPEHRRKGVATALACKLLRWSLEHDTDPHWDAANPESCTLAEKLGYVQTETYEAFYLRE